MRGTLAGTVVTTILASAVTYAVEQNRSRTLITNASLVYIKIASIPSSMSQGQRAKDEELRTFLSLSS